MFYEKIDVDDNIPIAENTKFYDCNLDNYELKHGKPLKPIRKGRN